MTKENPLGYRVARLRAASGEPVRTVILTRGGWKAVTPMPTRDELESALGMSRDVREARMARDGLPVWDVAMNYVGGDREHTAFYGSPDRRLWPARLGGTEREDGRRVWSQV